MDSFYLNSSISKLDGDVNSIKIWPLFTTSPTWQLIFLILYNSALRKKWTFLIASIAIKVVFLST